MNDNQNIQGTTTIPNENVTNQTNPTSNPGQGAVWQNTPYGYQIKYNTKPQETLADTEERARIYSMLNKTTIIFALLATLFMYKNFVGITLPLFAITGIAYMCGNLKLFGYKIKTYSFIYAAIILALSISTFMTGSNFFIFFNYVGLILMTFVFLLYNVYDTRKWDFSKTFGSIIESAFMSIGCLDDYSKDVKARKTLAQPNADGSKRKSTVGYIIIGLIIAVPVVGILLALLSQADKVFATFMDDYLAINMKPGDIFGVVITFVLAFFAGYIVMRYFSKKRINEEVKDKRTMEPVIAITVLSIVSVVYLLFSLIQILYLFIGNMTLPDNYTYAEYAREGFFQLLAVCIINVLMVLFVKKHFRSHMVLKLLMTLISLCTYIMIASSAMRMILYIQVYHLSFQRILVLWTLGTLGVLLIGVIASIFIEKFPLFRYGVLIVSLFYIVFSFSRVDYRIAKYNLSVLSDSDLETYNQNYEDGNYDTYYDDMMDFSYLSMLSTDAAPAIAEYKGYWVDEYYDNNENQIKDKRIRAFNISHYTARKLFENK